VGSAASPTEEIHPSSYGSPKPTKNPFNEKFSKTDTEAMAQLVRGKQLLEPKN
jgi:hypothetical protein